jgi:hypothetical protein
MHHRYFLAPLATMDIVLETIIACVLVGTQDQLAVALSVIFPALLELAMVLTNVPATRDTVDINATLSAPLFVQYQK